MNQEKELKFVKNVESLYAAHEKIYPRETGGVFQRLRKAAVWWLLGMYYLFAWLPYEGRQAVLFDLPARKFYVFGMTFWPQDFFFLSWLLIMAGLSLFFFTAIAGRLWCGFACPQTVWTEVFIWMERLVEGDRKDQIRLAKSPWNANKIRKRFIKQLLWISFALWTGFTFVGYFTPIRELGSAIIESVSGQYILGPWETFWILFYSLATYGNAGFLREQVCLYMCPYARFQSAMFDKDTLIISYDEQRGDPRMKGRKRKQAIAAGSSAGDCIDCGMCVQVCPTGIDIRDGLQYECISCSACIDVCNDVMDRNQLPRGLIRYTTENAMHKEKTRILRPRTLIYGSVLGALFIGFIIALSMRSPLAVDILRDRNALYRVVDEAHIENVYTLKVMNKGDKPMHYQVSVDGLSDYIVHYVRQPLVPPGAVENMPVRIEVPLASLKKRSTAISLTVSERDSTEAHQVTEKTRYFGPSVARTKQ